MADDYDRRREFGTEEGLARRLAMWANSLGRNKSYPWIGLGIVDDLKCAARLLGNNEDPNEFYTHEPARPAPTPEPAKVEYDL